MSSSRASAVERLRPTSKRQVLDLVVLPGLDVVNPSLQPRPKPNAVTCFARLQTWDITNNCHDSTDSEHVLEHK